MSEPNDPIERAYRALAREEPPASLDATILAASRRAVARPSLARRWGVPVSVAALLVLAIGVTLEMQHEQPGIELAAPGQQRIEMQAKSRPETQAKSKKEAPPKAQLRSNMDSQERAQPALAAPAKPAEPKPASPALREESRRKHMPEASAPSAVEAPAARELPRPFAEAPAAPQANATTQANPAPPANAATQANAAPQAERFQSAPAAASMAKRSATAGATADATGGVTDPREQLERIAKLREAGRDDEADRALEEFRRRYPDYRIDDAMWQRVKPR